MFFAIYRNSFSFSNAVKTRTKCGANQYILPRHIICILCKIIYMLFNTFNITILLSARRLWAFRKWDADFLLFHFLYPKIHPYFISYIFYCTAISFVNLCKSFCIKYGKIPIVDKIQVEINSIIRIVRTKWNFIFIIFPVNKSVHEKVRLPLTDRKDRQCWSDSETFII